MIAASGRTAAHTLPGATGMPTRRRCEYAVNLRYGRGVAQHQKPRTPAPPSTGRTTAARSKPGAAPTTPPEPAPVDRRRLLLLGGLALVALLGCALFWFDLHTQGAWGCTSVNVPIDAATGPTADAAVAAYAATGAAPADGWQNSEPNRFARTLDGKQMIIDLNQRDVNRWAVVRYDTCGPGVS